MSLRALRARVDRALEWTLAALMGAMACNVLWQVFTRWVLRDPSSVTEELARFGLIWVGLLGAAYGFGRRQHLAIDLLPQRLAGRRRLELELAIQVCVGAFALLALGVGGGLLVRLTLALGQSSAALGAPLGGVYLSLPLSGAIATFYAAAECVEVLARLRAGARET